jgi:hypothetical protein
MALYDTAANIINDAAIMCGLATVSDPYSSSAPEMIQMRGLLGIAGKELLTAYQWQELLATGTIATGAVPVSTGLYDMPADFNYMIDQTGWSPVSGGTGFPLMGPLSEQMWASVVAQGLSTVTLYLGFKVANRKINILPAPAPANITINYKYMSRYWVMSAATPDKDKPTAATDTIIYDGLLMSTMLAARYKQAKGLDATSALSLFTTQFAAITGVNVPAPILSLTPVQGYPYINPWNNLPPAYGT